MPERLTKHFPLLRPSAVRVARHWPFWLAPVLAVVLLAVPEVAHAQETIVKFGMKTVFEGFIAIGNFVLYLESWAVTQLLSFIDSVLSWQSVSNNPVIQDTWSIARDIMNMTFIVGLVVISFATIFRPTGLFQNFYYRTALPKFLLAAILINLSLGLSQTVVLVSNKMTTTLTNVLGSSTSRLTTILRADQMLMGPEITDTSATEANLRKVVGLGEPSTEDEVGQLAGAQREAFEECRTETGEGIAARAGRTVGNVIRGGVGFVTGSYDYRGPPPRKTAEDCLAELRAAKDEPGTARKLLSFAAYYDSGAKGLEALVGIFEWGAGQLAAAGDFNLGAALRLLVGQFFSIIMIGILIISLGSAVVFFLIRIAALWFLMAFSALAFGVMWIPGLPWFKKWWDMFLAWNVFGPIYLFVLIFGMTFLVRRGDLMAYVAASGGQIDLSTVMLENVFFFLFTLLVFVGGLMLALSSSFKGALAATPLAGAALSRLGAFGALNLSKRIGGAAWRRTGGAAADTAGATFQAARERALQTYERQRPEWVRRKSVEEKEAAAMRFLGVAGGAQAEYKSFSDRTNAAESKIRDQLKAMQMKPGETKAQFLARQNDFIRGLSKSRDRGTSMAASDMLIQRGEINVNQVKDLRNKKVPQGLAQAEFDKRMKGGDVDPWLAFEYQNDLDPTKHDEHAELFFGRLLRSPEAFSKLSPKYSTPTGPQLNAMKIAADRIWPKGTPTDPARERVQKDRARYNALQKLKAGDVDPSKRALADNIFS